MKEGEQLAWILRNWDSDPKETIRGCGLPRNYLYKLTALENPTYPTGRALEKVSANLGVPIWALLAPWPKRPGTIEFLKEGSYDERSQGPWAWDEAMREILD